MAILLVLLLPVFEYCSEFFPSPLFISLYTFSLSNTTYFILWNPVCVWCVCSQSQTFSKLQTPPLPTTSSVLLLEYFDYIMSKGTSWFQPTALMCFSSKVPVSLKGTVQFIMQKNLEDIPEVSLDIYESPNTIVFSFKISLEPVPKIQ